MGDATALAMEADRPVIRADGSDIAFVTVRVVDAEGRTVPRASQTLRLRLDGDGEIVATDNGDATSFEPFPSPTRKAFSGQALAIVRGRAGVAGTLTLRAEGEGLKATELRLSAR